MLGKKKKEKVLKSVDIKTGIKMLQNQIEQAKQLLNNTPISSNDNKAWNEQTAEFLIRI